MTVHAALIVLAAGFLAGAINTIVGSGSLITFPALLAVGFPPLVANVSNTVGLVFGSVSGAIGYRRELAGQRKRVLALLLPTIAGAALGAALLLTLPERFFNRIVPALIVIALLLVIAQPWLTKSSEHKPFGGWRERVLPVAVVSSAIYGGYFGAAQGVILISLLGVLLDDSLQRLNALKNALVAVVNGVAAIYFVIAAHVAWPAALMVALRTGGGRGGSQAPSCSFAHRHRDRRIGCYGQAAHLRFASVRTPFGLRLHAATPNGYVEVGPIDLNGVSTFSEWMAKDPARLLQAAPMTPGRGIQKAEYGPAVEGLAKIICVGRNYSQHISEMKNKPTGWPEVFARFPTTIVGPFDDIVRPRVSRHLDYEGELAVVIGKPGRYIPADRAMEHVFGFIVVNEATARDWQDGGRQWTPGKNFDGTFPIGPEVITADEVDWRDLAIETRVNGETVQADRTSQMLFDIPTLIEFISSWLTLDAGDIIATGTPGGVGAGRTPQRFLDPGDVVEVSIEGVGTIHNKVVEDERQASTDRWTLFLNSGGHGSR